MPSKVFEAFEVPRSPDRRSLGEVWRWTSNYKAFGRPLRYHHGLRTTFDRLQQEQTFLIAFRRPFQASKTPAKTIQRLILQFL